MRDANVISYWTGLLSAQDCSMPCIICLALSCDSLTEPDCHALAMGDHNPKPCKRCNALHAMLKARMKAFVEEVYSSSWSP